MLTTARAATRWSRRCAFPPRRRRRLRLPRVGARHGDFALCAVAAIADADGLRLAVGGVADRPVARDLPALEGGALDDALNAFAWELGGSDDAHASARYRRSLVRKLGRAALEEASQCRA